MSRSMSSPFGQLSVSGIDNSTKQDCLIHRDYDENVFMKTRNLRKNISSIYYLVSIKIVVVNRSQ